METDQRHITLTIGSHKFQVIINVNEEGLYRKAERELKKLMAEYSNFYTKEGGEYITLCAAIRLMVDYLKRENEIERLNKVIEDSKLLDCTD